jgi:hypothetical protein
MGGRLLEGPTMSGATSGWKEELGFLEPFLARLGPKARRQMCPLYVSGLIGPGDRKSIQPMAKQLGLANYDRYKTELLVQAGLANLPAKTDLRTLAATIKAAM